MYLKKLYRVNTAYHYLEFPRVFFEREMKLGSQNYADIVIIHITILRFFFCFVLLAGEQDYTNEQRLRFLHAILSINRTLKYSFTYFKSKISQRRLGIRNAVECEELPASPTLLNLAPQRTLLRIQNNVVSVRR